LGLGFDLVEHGLEGISWLEKYFGYSSDSRRDQFGAICIGPIWTAEIQKFGWAWIFSVRFLNH
jgi:hypothetical protein